MDHSPEIPEEIRNIFLEWATAGEVVASGLKNGNQFKPRIMQAAHSLRVLGECDETGTFVLVNPVVTYAKIKFMADVLEAMPLTITTAHVKSDVVKVRAWLVKNRGY